METPKEYDGGKKNKSNEMGGNKSVNAFGLSYKYFAFAPSNHNVSLCNAKSIDNTFFLHLIFFPSPCPFRSSVENSLQFEITSSAGTCRFLPVGLR